MNKYIRRIGHFFGELPIFSSLKNAALKYINPYEEKQRNKKFKKNGLKTLAEFHRIMIESNIDYSIVFGTLLGAVREHGFIKHDLDIDIGVWNTIDRSKLHSSLSKGGFKLSRCFETDNGDFGREETYEKNGVSIDIFYFYSYDDEYAYTTVLVPFEGCNDLAESIKEKGGAMPIQLILPFGKNIEQIKFQDIEVMAMNNRLKFIVSRYGENWRVPDPTFVYPKMGDAKCFYRKDKIAKLVSIS